MNNFKCLTPILLLIAAAWSGCFTPDYSDITFTCGADKRCPEGFSCRAHDNLMYCIRDGVNPDAGAVVDRAVDQKGDQELPDSTAPRPDIGPQEIKLVAPANLHPTSKRTVTFRFLTPPDLQYKGCALYVQGPKPGAPFVRMVTINTPPVNRTVNVNGSDLPEGKAVWKIGCWLVNEATQLNSTTRTIISSSEVIGGCRFDFQAGQRYRLGQDLVDKHSDCLVVKVSDVLIDGDDRRITSVARKDVIYNRGRFEVHTVLSTESKQAIWTDSVTLASKADSGISVADFNNDNRLDLVLPYEASKLAIFPNKGTNGTTPPRLNLDAPFTSTYQGLDAPRAADFDQDGMPDLMLAKDGDLDVFLRQTSAGSTFSFRADWRSATKDDSHNVDVANLDGDAKLDAIIGANHSSVVANSYRYFYLNQLTPGSGGWFNSWSSDKAGYTDLRQKGPVGGGSALVIDLNNDSHWDVVLPRVKGSTGQTCVPLINNGKGGFAPITADYSIPNCHPLTVADMDGDKVSELLTYDVGSTGVFTGVITYRSDGKGNLKKDNSLSVNGYQLFTAAVADLDDNGLPDVILGRDQLAQKALVLYSERASSSVDPVLTVPPVEVGTSVPGQTSQITPADLSGDGLLDLVISYRGDTVRGVNHVMMLHVNGGRGASNRFSTDRVLATAHSGHIQHIHKVVGDLDTKPTRGVVISGKVTNVTIRNFKEIRGFSRGVDVAIDPSLKDANITLDRILVNDPSIRGVSVEGANGVSISNVVVKNQAHGVGLTLVDARNVGLSDVTACPAAHSYNHTLLMVSAACRKTTITSASRVSLKLNNGCLVKGSTAAFSRCR